MTFDELRERIREEGYNEGEECIERLEELTPFQLGRCQGKIWAYNNILEIMRGIDKWGELE